MKALTTIAVPVFNQLYYTKLFIESVKSNTKIPYKFLFLDNGSTDGTKEYLKKENITVISKNKNIGVVRAWNELVKSCQTKYICIMNNDIVVAPYWLVTMQKTLEREENIYCVQPYTTNHNLPDNFPNNYYPQAEIQKSDRLSGWCFMLRMSVFKEIGLFDQQFDMAWYEDRDFNNRLNKAGFYPHTVLASYIHHFQNRTLWTVDNIEDKMAENELKYQEKWGKINQLNNNNMSNMKYKISNPVNFPDPPDGSEISKGQVKYYDYIPDWAKNNNSFVVEKLGENDIIESEVEIPSTVRDIASEIKRKHEKLKEEILKDNKEKADVLADNDKMEEKEVFKCEICGREFSTKRGLSMHITKAHKDN